MRLDYLLFDVSDGDDGSCCFDALASVAPERLPALVREIEAVLNWASRDWGPPTGTASEGEWAFDLQATGASGALLGIGFDSEEGKLSVASLHGEERVTIAFTVSGSTAFGAAFRESFPEAD